MNEFKNIFLASQDEFFDVLDRRLRELEVRMRDSEELMETLCGMNDQLSQRAILLSQRSESPTSWAFDARMPNLSFTDLFEAETIGEISKRWVGKSCQLSGQLLLDRRHQYLVEVKIADFISPEAEASFSLVVDGIKRPWHSKLNRIFTTLVAEAPNETALDFVLQTEPQATPEGSDVSFSFERIAFMRPN